MLLDLACTGSNNEQSTSRDLFLKNLLNCSNSSISFGRELCFNYVSKVAERLDLLLFEQPFIIKTNCVFSGLGEVE